MWILTRQKKAVKIFSRPTAGLLRLVVHGQTLKYNIEVRAGRGFSLEELKVWFRTLFSDIINVELLFYLLVNIVCKIELS